MGERSQIFVRYTDSESGKCYLTARYYDWNFGERMISRCRHTLEWLKDYMDNELVFHIGLGAEKLTRILDTNFDMRDVVISSDIVKEYQSDSDWKEIYGLTLNDYIFWHHHNNNGRLLIDIKDCILKYAFLDKTCSTDNIMTAAQYMKWNMGVSWALKDSDLSRDARKVCLDNLLAIKKLAVFMSKEEVEDFLNYDYEADMQKNTA